MNSTGVEGKSNVFLKAIVMIGMIIGALISVFPFYWMLAIGTSESTAAFQTPPKLSIGSQLSENFSRVLDKIDFFTALGNSFFVASITTIFVVFFCSLAGFAFAKYDFPGKKILFLLVLATLFVPQQLSVLPNYVIMSKLHWIDSFKAIIVPGMVNAFGIFWMRQYISTSVHKELLEAARIDGSGHFRTYRSIVLPVIKPAFATLGILTFMNVWNDFFWPLVILKNKQNFTIQIALTYLRDSHEGLNYGMIMSATFFATLPLLVVFLFFSRWFIAGLTSGAIKS